MQICNDTKNSARNQMNNENAAGAGLLPTFSVSQHGDKRSMSKQQKHDLLDGVTLEQMLTALVDDYGWEKLGKYIKIRCFTTNPTINSSLKLLRKTDWARTKVENLYISMKTREKKSWPPEK